MAVSSCVQHPMSAGDRICGRCGHHFCNTCVVFPFGASKPPMCVACALEHGGVRRQSTGRPKLTRRSIRERLEAHRHASAAAEAAAAAAAAEAPPADGADQDTWLGDDFDPDRVPGAWRQEF